MKDTKKILSLALSVMSVLLIGGGAFGSKINASAAREYDEYSEYSNTECSKVASVECKRDEVDQAYLDSLRHDWVTLGIGLEAVCFTETSEGKINVDFMGTPMCFDEKLYIIDGSDVILLDLSSRTFTVEKGSKYKAVSTFAIPGRSFVFNKAE